MTAILRIFTRFSAKCGLFVLSIGLLAAFGSPVCGDTIKTHDGRQFEGQVLVSPPDVVRVDTMVSGIRVTLSFPAYEVESIEKRPVPEGFYEAEAEEPAESPEEPKESVRDPSRYLEVPVVGRFGVQVVPAGIRDCLAYAVRSRISTIVFYVDSEGGEQLAAREIYKILSQYDKRLNYHAIVRDSVGVAMAVTVWCEKVFLLPGSNLGGVILAYDKDAYDGDPEVLRSQTAYEVSVAAEKKGWPAEIVRAMIDPTVRVAAWRGEDGKVVTGARAPESVSPGDMVLLSGPDAVVTLNRSEAAALGVGRPYAGGAAGLGSELGIAGWAGDSEYGRSAMIKAAASQRKRMETATAKHEEKIKKLLDRRDATKRYVDRNLTLANSWDPEQSAYSTFDRHKSSWERYWGGGDLPGTISRTRWRELTDQTVLALRRARKGVRELQKLEEEAESLGVDRVNSEGELEKILDDAEVKIRLLLYWRTRKTKAA